MRACSFSLSGWKQHKKKGALSGLAWSGEATPGVLQATQRKKEEKEDNNKNNIMVGLRKLLAFLFSFGVGEGACALSLGGTSYG